MSRGGGDLVGFGGLFVLGCRALLATKGGVSFPSGSTFKGILMLKPLLKASWRRKFPDSPLYANQR